MRRTPTIVFGICGLAAAAAAWVLWPTSYQRIDLDREIVEPAPAARAPRPPAPAAPAPTVFEPPAAPLDSPPPLPPPDDAPAPAAAIDYAGILPQIIDDPELRAEFEQMLNDPDPEVRREAEELVEIWLSE